MRQVLGQNRVPLATTMARWITFSIREHFPANDTASAAMTP
jgi:hypothetical protein